MASSGMNLMKMSTSKDEMFVKCDVCNKQFARRDTAKAHRRTHFAPAIRPFHCLKCPATFTRKIHLERHQQVHTNEPLSACDICDAYFSSIYQTIKHRKVHQPRYALRWFASHPGVVEPVKCEICGGLFVHKRNLQRHRSIHNSARPYVCRLCGASFKDFSNKEDHYDVGHRGTKPFWCTQCDCKYEHKADLSHHLHLHFSSILLGQQERAE